MKPGVGLPLRDEEEKKMSWPLRQTGTHPCWTWRFPITYTVTERKTGAKK